jgi:riboflavin-specific deaminase-like protein
VIISGRGTLNPGADIFRHRFSPIIVLTTQRASTRDRARLRGVADDVEAFGDREFDFAAAFHWLQKKWGANRILCEGGGELDWALLRRGLVDEIYQTVCPLIFGGRDAPTLADGEGVKDVRKAVKLRMKTFERVGQELFLVYRVLNKRRARTAMSART